MSESTPPNAIDPFLGRYPQNQDAPTDLMPDVTLNSLRMASLFGGIFGIDRFMLGDMGGGMAKLFTGGGFLFWWLWDVLQIWTEGDHVVTYGLSLPFDYTYFLGLSAGVGQGRITDRTVYTSSGFGWWVIGLVFGFLGLDALAVGKYSLFIIRLFYMCLFGVSAYGAIISLHTGGIWNIFLFVLFLIPAILLGILALGPWVEGLIAIGFNDIRNNPIKYRAKNFYNALTVSSEHMTYPYLDGEELRHMFAKKHNAVQEGGGDPDNGSEAVSFVRDTLYAPIGAVGKLMSAALSGIVVTINPPSAISAAIAKKTVAALEKTEVDPNRLVNSVLPQQTGGARLSIESQVMGAAVIALIAGGSLKGLIDSVIPK